LAFVLLACRDDAPGADAQAVTPVPTVTASLVEASVAEDLPDAEADADVHDMMDRAIRLLEEGADIAQANMSDCEKMGDQLEVFRQAHLAGIKETDTIYETKYAAEFERLKPSFSKRYHAAWRRLQPGINKCRRSPKMKKVILEIWGTQIPDAGPPPT